MNSFNTCTSNGIYSLNDFNGLLDIESNYFLSCVYRKQGSLIFIKQNYTYTYTRTHTHARTHTHINIYIYFLRTTVNRCQTSANITQTCYEITNEHDLVNKNHIVRSPAAPTRTTSRGQFSIMHRTCKYLRLPLRHY